MDIICAIASIHAFLIAFLVSTRKQKRISDYILIAWIVNFAFHFAIPFFVEHQFWLHDSIWGVVMAVFVFAHAPFIFVYTSSLTNPEFKVNLKNFYHFGFLLLFIASFTPYLLLTPEERLDVIYQRQDLSYYVVVPLLVLFLTRVYFLLRTIIIVINHQNKISQSFSYEKEINLAWIKSIAIGFFIIIILGFIGLGLVSAHIMSVYWMDYITILCNMILFFYIAFWSYKQNAISSVIQIIEVVEVPTKEKTITRIDVTSSPIESLESSNPTVQNLLKLMDHDKLYLEPELNIADVANKLNIHGHQLSKILNTQLQKNFFEFVNDYRIEEFKNLVSNPKNKHISILGLAMDAGFNSKATFNRIFKKSTGITPSKFREDHKI